MTCDAPRLSRRLGAATPLRSPNGSTKFVRLNSDIPYRARFLMYFAAGYIKSLDPDHLITAGYICSLVLSFPLIYVCVVMVDSTAKIAQNFTQSLAPW